MEWAVTAHPVDDHDPDDPVEILGVVPEGYHAQFLAEYTAAVEGVRRPEQESSSRPVDGGCRLALRGGRIEECFVTPSP
jgi:hypothetical protein